MPLIYSKEKEKRFYMKELKDITRAELDVFKKHRHLLEYTKGDVAELDNTVRLFINKNHQTCSSCSNTLRAAKDMLNQFYALHGEKMEEYATINETPKQIDKTELEIAKDEVKEYTQEKKKRNKKYN